MFIKRLLVLTSVLCSLFLFTTAFSDTEEEQQGGLTSKQRLGKSIFFDKHLSLNQNQACAACHALATGTTGDEEKINKGGGVYEGSVPGRFGDRKPPASAYAPFSPVFALRQVNGEALFVGGNFWDGRATGEKLGNPAADQAQGPFLNPVEQALADSACVVYRVCNPVTPADYPVKFQEVWGVNACQINWPADIKQVCATDGGKVNLSSADRTKSNTAFDNIAVSISKFEGSPAMSAFSSKFDLAVKGRAFLSLKEWRGLRLFIGKGKCVNCHTLAPGSNGRSLFTDFTFDNIGIPKNPANPVYQSNPNFVDPGLGGFLATRKEYAQYADENVGKHKVATLRNVDLRPRPDFVKAYMHNAYFKTLEGIVHFYNTRDIVPRCAGNYTEAKALANNCWPAPEVTANLNTAEVGSLGLSLRAEADIVAFLKTLNDGYVVKSADLEQSTPEEELGEYEDDGVQDLYLPMITFNQ